MKIPVTVKQHGRQQHEVNPVALLIGAFGGQENVEPRVYRGRPWLKAGVMEKSVFHQTDLGSPESGVIRALLQNVYLHYLDPVVWDV